MYLGRIVEIGPARDIYSDPKHPYTEALLSAILPVDIPRPRSLKTMALPRFGQICDEIRTLFGAELHSEIAL